MDYYFWSCWPMRSQRPPNNSNIIIVLVYPPELDGKNLFLQTSQTGVIEHGNIKLALALKLHPFQLAFIVLRNALGMLPEQKSNYQSYPAVIAASHSNNWPDNTCSGGTNVMGVTNHFLIGFKACFTRRYPYLTLLSTYPGTQASLRS